MFNASVILPTPLGFSYLEIFSSPSREGMEQYHC